MKRIKQKKLIKKFNKLKKKYYQLRGKILWEKEIKEVFEKFNLFSWEDELETKYIEIDHVKVRPGRTIKDIDDLRELLRDMEHLLDHLKQNSNSNTVWLEYEYKGKYRYFIDVEREKVMVFIDNLLNQIAKKINELEKQIENDNEA